MASPFVDKTFSFTQPDGTKIEVRGWGDQHYAVFETLDGYTVVKNPSTGFFEIAQVSSDLTMLEPAPGPQGNMDGAVADVPRGVRIDREAARACGPYEWAVDVAINAASNIKTWPKRRARWEARSWHRLSARLLEISSGSVS